MRIYAGRPARFAARRWKRGTSQPKWRPASTKFEIIGGGGAFWPGSSVLKNPTAGRGCSKSAFGEVCVARLPKDVVDVPPPVVIYIRFCSNLCATPLEYPPRNFTSIRLGYTVITIESRIHPDG
jgi:hypothetical protein